ncbi:complement C1q tumor necrosis factor-related protein 3-like [Mytilus edulis]|uniref:complement C1q tumor necrosis factor-related protein 3-like n=1 Tax=Mytilus edulis TaxID=6550 RepID=UPI0039F13C78
MEGFTYVVFLALFPLFWSPAQSKKCCSNNKLMRSIKYQFNLMNPDECGGETSDRVKSAFSANLHKHLSKVTQHTKIIFGTVITNTGDAYDKATGVFTSPRDGTFYFSWTMFTNPGGSCPTELVKNGNSVGLANHTWNDGSKWNHSSTQSGVLSLKKHDSIWIRMIATGEGYCYSGVWTSFNGFEI